jgi:hypothetical protein
MPADTDRRLRRPQHVGGVPVVQRVLRLHARGDAQACEPREVAVPDELSVLDRPCAPVAAKASSAAVTATSPIACSAISRPDPVARISRSWSSARHGEHPWLCGSSA